MPELNKSSLCFDLAKMLINLSLCMKSSSVTITGESLFTLFASLTCLSLSDDANKIKTLNIERA